MLALLLLASAATAQLPENLPPLSANGGFIAASVADVDSSAEWYARLLDLKIVLRPPEREGRRMVALEGKGMLIELIEERDAVPLEKAAPSIDRDYLVHGIFKGGFLVSD
ncbi:MAG: hypothetical protein ABIS23_00785 [Sphingomicrobium sp.]